MLRFIVKSRRYDGTCLNEVFTHHITVDCEAPALENLLRAVWYGGGPNNDAFLDNELVACEVLDSSEKKDGK